VLHETISVAGNAYLFGGIDVPAIERDKSPIAPFDASRSLKLNPNNELVQAIHRFVESKLKLVSDEYDAEERKRRQSEEERQLRRYADQVGRVLNRHFQALRSRPRRRSSHFPGGTDNLVGGMSSNGLGELLLAGAEIGAIATPPPTKPSEPSNGSKEKEDQQKTPPAQALARAEDTPATARAESGAEQKTSRGGGFVVHYVHHGREADRAKYAPEERAIYVNLDHPQLIAALGASTLDSPSFQRLANEVAFAEYAIAVALELAEAGKFATLSEPAVEIRDALNWLAREAATL
jgi:hypothetical protein